MNTISINSGLMQDENRLYISKTPKVTPVNIHKSNELIIGQDLLVAAKPSVKVNGV